MSILHWLIVLSVLMVYCLAFIYPVARIIARTGHSPWLAVLAFIPVVNFVALWVFAFIKWPNQPGEPHQS
ncbi:MAG: hypothetical protein HY859_08950 [Caulobacterales bacterium]|nr:hypothetical protein [Caulobacterales bacterium]